MDQKITETIITGMTKGELAAVICITVVIIGVAIWVLGYVMQLHLKPLKDVPKQLSEIKSSLKSGTELNLMIKTQVQDHELHCPARAMCQSQSPKEAK
jgi:hypothetical protein